VTADRHSSGTAKKHRPSSRREMSIVDEMAVEITKLPVPESRSGRAGARPAIDPRGVSAALTCAPSLASEPSRGPGAPGVALPILQAIPGLRLHQPAFVCPCCICRNSASTHARPTLSSIRVATGMEFEAVGRDGTRYVIKERLSRRGWIRMAAGIAQSSSQSEHTVSSRGPGSFASAIQNSTTNLPPFSAMTAQTGLDECRE
jgi:hypothetical protein